MTRCVEAVANLQRAPAHVVLDLVALYLLVALAPMGRVIQQTIARRRLAAHADHSPQVYMAIDKKIAFTILNGLQA